MLREELRDDRRRDGVHVRVGGFGGDQKQLQLQLQGPDAQRAQRSSPSRSRTSVRDDAGRGRRRPVDEGAEAGVQRASSIAALAGSLGVSRRPARAVAAPCVRRRRRRRLGRSDGRDRATCTCGSRRRRARSAADLGAAAAGGAAPTAPTARRDDAARPGRDDHARASGRRRSITLSASRVVTVGANIAGASVGRRDAATSWRGVDEDAAAAGLHASRRAARREPERGVRAASSRRSASRCC